MTHYQITCDDVTIHDSLAEGVFVDSPTCDFAMGGTGQMDFKLPPGHVAYDLVKKLKGDLTLLIDGEWAWSGRVLNDEVDFAGNRIISVEGELGILNDFRLMWEPVIGTDYDTTTVSDTVYNITQAVIDNGGPYIGLGNITVPTPAGYNHKWPRYSYPSAWGELTEKLLSVSGGYFRMRRNALGIRYLDYLAEYGQTNPQVIHFGENLLDLKKYVRGEDVITRLIPLGAVQGDGSRLTIKSVNSGLVYLRDTAAESLYGIIWGTAEFDDVTSAAALKTRGEETLAARKLLGISLEIKAIDLSLIDVSLDRIEVGDRIRVVSEPHGVDSYMDVRKLHLDLADPEQSSIELGASYTALTDATSGAVSAGYVNGALGAYPTRSSVTQQIDTAKTETLADVDTKLVSGTWTTVTLGGSWAIYVGGGGYPPAAGYWKDATGVVHLRGLLTAGTANATIFTLPVGYRPEYTGQYAVAASGAANRCVINSSGTVVLVGAAGAGQVSLDGINFRAL